jgi:hypothetical protein
VAGRADRVDGLDWVPALGQQQREAQGRAAVDAHVAVREDTRVRVFGQSRFDPGHGSLEPLRRDCLAEVVETVVQVRHAGRRVGEELLVRPLHPYVHDVGDPELDDLGQLKQARTSSWLSQSPPTASCGVTKCRLASSAPEGWCACGLLCMLTAEYMTRA